jgi:hypothetical protein
MNDEPTRRRFADRDSNQEQQLAAERELAGGPAQTFGVVLEHPSNRPEAFSEREQPTLASPNSVSNPTPGNQDQRLTQVMDRVFQLETDLEIVYAQLEHLKDAIGTEQLRGRAARMGRYLLWGAVIAAMATFWMLLRLRAGSP